MVLENCLFGNIIFTYNLLAILIDILIFSLLNEFM